LRQSGGDRVTLIGAGVTLHSCLAAAAQLAADGIAARVIDLYSVKPIDVGVVGQAISDTRRLVVVEDHYPEGGIGAAVLEAMADHPDHFLMKHLAVKGLPGSGKPDELMEAAGISVGHIVEAARALAHQEV
jgi:transketolase